MSLINDALRRASQDHKDQAGLPPPPNLPGNPPAPTAVEPPPRSLQPSPMVLGAIGLVILGLLGLGGWFAWKAWGGHRAKPGTQPVLTNRALRIASPAKPPPLKTNLSAMGASPLPTQTVAAPSPGFLPAATSPPPAKITLTNAALTNMTARMAPPVKWPSLRLQGIIYNPPNSSVLINNKMLFVDDEIQGVKVVEIGRRSATVVLGGQTNTLSLR